MKRKLALLLVLVLCLTMAVPVFAEETDSSEEPLPLDTILIAPAPVAPVATILYTNDIHSYINGDVRYSAIAGYRDTLDNVLLVDAGDHIQGNVFGALDQGASVQKLMAAAGYDVATMGNHEFDYGMERAMQVIKEGEVPYVSCNFCYEENGAAGENVLDSYKVFEVNGLKIAVIGISTPETFTSSTPKFFQDDEGNFIYSFARGNDGADLYAAVQKAIDDASEEADVIIALGHLGVSQSSKPWTSEDVIANTTGLDAFIDGHSHHTVPMREVADKNGDTVILTQTGSYFAGIGQLNILDDGTITSEVITSEALAAVEPNAEVKELEDAWIAEVEAQLGTVIGSFTDVMANYTREGERLVRKQETNTGDFCADALYYLFDSMELDVDIAVMNGGGIRNTVSMGDITYMTCKEIHTFGNVACLQTVTGQQILDALEWGARFVGTGRETGSFLHVSGLKYTVDTAIESTVQMDESGVWAGGPTGEYRVKDVMVRSRETGEYEALELTAQYNLAGYNYTLCNLGDGCAMFAGAVNVLDYVMTDDMVLANYVQSFENGVVTGYAQPQGRITILEKPAEEPAEEEPVEEVVIVIPARTYTVAAGDCLWSIAQKYYGTGREWGRIAAANSALLTNPSLIYAGMTLVIPD